MTGRAILDPDDNRKWIIDGGTEPFFGFPLPGPVVIGHVHLPSSCAGRHCVIHNPSEHHMSEWSLNWRSDTFVMERLCPHGTGHPDPDDAVYRNSLGQFTTHGCCRERCCIR